MTKARVRVAATAIAKISSGGEEPLTDLLLDLDRLREAVDQRRGDVEVVAGEGGEADHPVERVAQRPRRHRRPQRFEDRGAGPQPEDFDRLAEHVEFAAVDEQVEVLAAFGRRSAWRSPGWPARAAR